MLPNYFSEKLHQFKLSLGVCLSVPAFCAPPWVLLFLQILMSTPRYFVLTCAPCTSFKLRFEVKTPSGKANSSVNKLFIFLSLFEIITFIDFLPREFD